jgi:hypothetical protein
MKASFKPYQNNLKNTKMTAAEICAAYPESTTALRNEGIAEGIKAEKSRTKAWMAFNGIDPEAVTAGINSGEPVTMDVIAEMSIKAASKRGLADAKAENAPDISAATAPKTTKDADVQLEANTKELFKLLGLK